MNKFDCPVELVDGKWTCPQCNWIHPTRGLDEARPLHNCLRGPKGIDRVLATVARWLEDMAAVMTPAVEVKIRTCYDCDRFGGQACTERGSKCKHFERWIERLLFGQCEAWSHT